MASIKWRWWAVWMAVWCGAAGEVCAQCETQRLVPADGAAGDQFGTSCAIAGDRIIVGAPLHNGTIGAAYVFVRTSTGWMQEAKLSDAHVLPGDDFGRTVSISGDFAAVGAPKDDRGGTSTDLGRVYMYSRPGPDWISEDLQVPNGIPPGSEFGTSVSVSGDAVLVGAPLTDEVSLPTGIGNSGSAYVFRRNATTGVWSQEAKLTASDAQEFDQFGFTVALHGDTAFVTAFADKDPTISLSNTIGSVYVFRKQGVVWVQTQKLVPSDAAGQGLLGSRNFGRSLSTDGMVLLVGERSGQSAYVFRFDGSAWVEEAILKKPAGDTAPDQFGNSVAIQGDSAFVGAWLDDDNALANSGSIFVYQRVSGTWVFNSIFHGSSAGANGRLGTSVAVDGVYAVAGAISPTTSGEALVLAVQPVPDCDGNLVQDECELYANPSVDINQNGHIDACECTMDSECDDNVPCTANACDPVSGFCVFTPLPGFCLIAGICHGDGTQHPDNECRQCDVTLAVTDWSFKSDGFTCSEDGNVCTQNVCLSGFCSHPGEPLGLPCGDASDSACDKPDYCDGAGQCFQSFVAFGTNCDDGLYCNGVGEKCNGVGACVMLNPPPCVTNQTLTLCDEVHDICVQCLSGSDCATAGQCPGNYCDMTGLCQLDPALVGTPCGDPATTQCSLPDTCAAAETCAPNHLPDGTLCSPDADPCTFDVCVSGTCAHAYDLPIAMCGPLDCNCNGAADACDIALGLSADCDENATPDECELPLFAVESPQLSPVGAGFPQSFILSAPPKATGDVTLRFAARGDFLAASEKVAVSVNGMAAGEIFTFGGLDCPVTPDDDVLVIAAALFNQAVGGGDAVIDMIATAAVDAELCVPASWIAVSISYRGVQTGDCNGNGEFDTCEVQAGTQPDCNHNHVPDICEPDCDADGVPDACALHYYPANDEDCNNNGLPDRCDVIYGRSADCNSNLVPDECETDCQLNGILDECEIMFGTSLDCNDDQVPDECLTTPAGFTASANIVSTDGLVALGVPQRTFGSYLANVYRWAGDTWIHEVAWAPTTGNAFVSGAIEQDIAVVTERHIQHNPFGVFPRAARVFQWTGGSWQEYGQLDPDNVANYASFGSCVGISGDTVVIGEPRSSRLNNNGQEVFGAVHVFRSGMQGWQKEALLISPSATQGVYFGMSVAIDQNWLAIGAPHQYFSGPLTASLAFVALYEYDGSTWVLRQIIPLPSAEQSYDFGEFLALSQDTLAVGCASCDGGKVDGGGAVYLYHRIDEHWELETALPSPGTYRYASFGASVALDGEDMLVCAPREPQDVSANGILIAEGTHDQAFGASVKYYQGVTYAYRRAGGAWREEFRLPMNRLNVGGTPGAILAVGAGRALITDDTLGAVRAFDLHRPSCYCPEATILGVDPVNGVVDARQSFELSEPAIAQGLKEVTLAGVSRPSLECWHLEESPSATSTLHVINDWDNNDGTATLEFNRPVNTNVMVWVKYTNAGNQSQFIQFTSHPANVDGGPFADADDVAVHVQCCLSGSVCGAEYGKYRCDINHSQVTTAEDLIRVLDLLNGAGAYSPQLGTPLPTGP